MNHLIDFAVRNLTRPARRPTRGRAVGRATMESLEGRLLFAASDVAYDWKNVEIRGGGFATDVVIHPQDSNIMYARSDVAAFRWDPAGAKWVSIVDSFMNGNQYPSAGLAVDPNDATGNVVYAAIGYDWNVTREMDIYKSTDRGNTWVASNVGGSTPIFVGGGSAGRWLGQRLVVDPNNSNVVYYGSQNDGLWRSTSGSSVNSWSQVSAFTARGNAKYGLASIGFDASGGTTGGVTKNIFVSVNGDDANGGGVYYSSNGGATWTEFGGATIERANRLSVGSDGRVWVAANNGVFTAARGATALSATNVTAGTWTVTVNPFNPNHVMIGGDNQYNVKQTFNALSASPTWNGALGSTSTADAPWRNDTVSYDSIGTSITFDPNGAGKKVWVTDWYQPWVSDDVTVTSPAWRSVSKGYETLVTHGLVTAPSGAPLFSLVADANGFRHADITQAPTKKFTRIADGTGLAYCEEDPNFMAQTGGFTWGREGGGMALSTDNGVTWTAVGPGGEQLGGDEYNERSRQYNVGKIVVGSRKQANGYPVLFYAPGAPVPYPDGTPRPAQPPIYSLNWGQTWSPTTMADGTPMRTNVGGAYNDVSENFAADKMDGNTIYWIRGSWGYGNDVMRSTNGGQTWSKLYTWSDTGGHETQTRKVQSVPGRTGDVWVSLYDEFNPTWGTRLARSTNGGVAWTNIANVKVARSVSFGKAASGAAGPTAWVLGTITIDGVDYKGLFRSDNATTSTFTDARDATWKRVYAFDGTYATGINNQKFLVMQADRQTYGRVYVGTGGRGVWVGNDGAPAPAPTLPTGWSAGDVGAPGQAGSASSTDGASWTVVGGGADIWGASDQFQFASRSWTGDGSIVARVTAVGATDPWAKAGVMIRDGVGANARNVLVALSPSNGVRYQWRATTGGSTLSAGAAATAPRWVKLTRAGSTFTAFHSADGNGWTQVGAAQTVSMASTVRIGLVVTSHNNALLSTSTFTNVSVTAAAAAKLTGTVIGTSGSYNNLGNDITKVFDGNLNTYFDAPTPSGAWVGLDLGSSRLVTQVRYAPRFNYANRMVGGRIQGSNSATFSSGVVDLFTITTAPPDGTYQSQAVTGSFRYVRYLAPDGSNGNLSEFEVWGL